MNKKSIGLTMLAIMLLAASSSLVLAQSNIHLIPIGGTITGTAPILAYSPADCRLSVQASKTTVNNVWMVLVVDQATYDSMSASSYVQIGQTDPDNQTLTEHSPVQIALTGFTEISDSDKFPPIGTSAPGCTHSNQYNTQPFYGFLGVTDTTQKLYYKMAPISDTLLGGVISSVEGTDQDQLVTITVNGLSGDFKIVVLLMGHDASDTSSTVLDMSTAVTDTPLITTPEISTLILIPVGLGVAAYYIKRKQTVKT